MSAAPSRLGRALRWADLVVLALALPAFVLADLPLLGYTVFTVVWLTTRAIGVAAERHTRRLLAEGNRRAALGTTGATTLGRVWTVTLAVLLVGLADRESGLAAAILAAIIFTIFITTNALARLFEPEAAR